METIEIILYLILFGFFSLVVLMFVVEYLIKFLSDDNKLKIWWKRNVIDKDPYE